MANWALVRGNDVLPITDRAPFDLISASGIGVAPIRRLASRSPSQDGDTDLGYRLDPRMINLALIFNAGTRAGADAARALLYEYVKPASYPLQLRCTRDDGAIRQLDVYPVGTIDAAINDQDRIWGSQRLAIQLKASEPIWYNPQIQYWAAVGGAATGASGFAIPMAVPWVQVANTAIDAGVNLTYAGSWASYPIVTIYGPCTGASLENVTTGQLLYLPTVSLTAGQYITIDLRYGHKTVLDQLGDNRIGELSDGSDLADFRLAPAPEASNGINVLHFAVAAGATSATGVQVAYYERYIGL